MSGLTFGELEVHGFAPRQSEAIALTAQGLSSKEVARSMGISPRTVEMALTNAMLRLGARNRVHLITRAIASGALRVIATAPALTLCFLLANASMPADSVDADPDQFLRLSARSSRGRRQRDDLLPHPTNPDEDETA